MPKSQGTLLGAEFVQHLPDGMKMVTHTNSGPVVLSRLDQNGALSMLMDMGLLHSADIVSGHLRIQDLSSRNSNLSLACDRIGYFIKQAGRADAVETVKAEVHIYKSVLSQSSTPKLDRHIPQFVAGDEEHGWLVTELMPNAEKLTNYHARTGKFSTERAGQMGKFLAQIHGTTFVPRMLPDGETGSWASSLARPPLDLVHEASSANIQLLKILQAQSQLSKSLSVVQSDWNATAFIHGDIKWDNVLVRPRKKDVEPEWWLIDWELGGRGDARWDAGCVLAEFLRCWVVTTAITGETDPSHIPTIARYPLEGFRRSIGRFCVEYARSSGCDLNFFVDSSRFAAARLVQIVYEHMQFRDSISSQAICLLQLSDNILRRPLDAVLDLMGGRSWA